MRRIFLIDSNCLNQLSSARSRERLRANLRVTGKEFWPTGSNVLEALKSRDPEKRTRFLRVLADLADGNHSITLATEVLRRIAVAVAYGNPGADLSEPAFTALFRDPGDVSDEEATQVREYLLASEGGFSQVHQTALATLRPLFKAEGGMKRWPTVRVFLDETWTREEHLGSYVEELWRLWELPGSAPYAQLLDYDAWRLFFDGWGATVYQRQIVHPQRGKVQLSDVTQLAYLGIGAHRVFATEDDAFRELGNEVLNRSYAHARMVRLDEMLD